MDQLTGLDRVLEKEINVFLLGSIFPQSRGFPRVNKILENKNHMDFPRVNKSLENYPLSFRIREKERISSFRKTIPIHMKIKAMVSRRILENCVSSQKCPITTLMNEFKKLLLA